MTWNSAYHTRMNPPTQLIDWNAIDTVLLDMDGTLLDLHFDNWFWMEHLPKVYALTHGMAIEEVHTQWASRLASFEQRLQWYCIDHWSEQLQLDVAAIKRDVKHRVQWLPGAQRFLEYIKGLNKRRILITNAHPITLAIKDEVVAVMPWFDRCISSHNYLAPKEDPRFWPQLVADTAVDPARCLFVDDSLPVLQAAAAFGIAEIVAIRRPDSQQPARAITQFKSVDKIIELGTGLSWMESD